MLRVGVAVLAAAAASTLAAVLASGSALGSPVGCGAVLTHDTVLAGDLTGCAGDGLIIGASGITVDLAGHTISGTRAAGSVGIRDVGFDRVKILNGGIGPVGAAVPGFDVGVALTGGANHNQLRGLSVFDNASDGIAISGSSGNRIEGSTVSDNDAHGIVLRDSTGNLLRGNRVNANNQSGSPVDEVGNIALIDSERNRVLANDMSVSNATGILLRGADHNVIARNLSGSIGSDGNGGYGIALFGSDRNQVRGNTAAENVLGGIFVAAGSRGNRLTHNVASLNRADGIHVDDPATTILRNIADDNAVDLNALGIEAVPGVVAHGNEAHGNGNPLQCLNVVCS